MNKKLVSSLVAFFIVSSSTAVYGKAAKDETVYASLRGDGSIADIKIVNHVYGSEAKEYYTDYGTYKSIKNLSGYEKPIVAGNEIKWPMALLKGKGLYYEGSIDKELPVKIQIQYFLGDKEIKADELEGKSGHLKIELKVSFDLKDKDLAAQLMAQIQLAVSQDIFKNIVTEGSRVVVGKKSTISFVALPPKEQSFFIEMDGNDIELEPINITLLSSADSMPKDLTKGLNKLADGLGEMSQGSKGIEGGMSELINGTRQLRIGMDKLSFGIGSLTKASQEAEAGSKEIYNGMNEFHKGILQAAKDSGDLASGVSTLSGGLNELAKNSREMNSGIIALNDGINVLSSGIDSIAAGMDNLQGGHEQLVLLAKALLSNPAFENNVEVKALANGVISEAQGLKAMTEVVKQSGSGIKEIGKNTKKLSEGYSQFNAGLLVAADNTKLMAEQVSKLPEGLKKMGDNFSKLGSGVNQIFGGFGEINKALNSINKEISGLPSNVEKLTTGQSQMKNGIIKLRTEGLDAMKTELQNNLNDSILGNKEEVTYTSFADNERNVNSTVQFILRTPAIRKPEVNKVVEEVKEEKKGFIERLIDLFR